MTTSASGSSAPHGCTDRPATTSPAKIVAAADRLPPSAPLPVVADERGSPTFTRDLATAMVGLLGATDGGLFHLVNHGAVSRFEVAAHVLARCRPGRELRPISGREFVRDSDPPPCAVLDAGKAGAAAGIRMRGWSEALDDYLSELC